MVWEEDLDNMESTQSRKSAILLCLTSGRTINLSEEKKKENIAAIDFMTPNEKQFFFLSKLETILQCVFPQSTQDRNTPNRTMFSPAASEQNSDLEFHFHFKPS